MDTNLQAENLLKEYGDLCAKENHHAYLNDGTRSRDPFPEADRLAEVRGRLLARLQVNDSFRYVPMPETVGQAELMEKVGYAYLKEHAPDRIKPLELRDPPLGMFAIVNGEDCIWDGEDWAPARILKHRLPMKLTPEMAAAMAEYIEGAPPLADAASHMQELWDRALQAWMKWPPAIGDNTEMQEMLNFVAEQVDAAWREKVGHINCTEICAIIRGAVDLARPIHVTPTVTVDPMDVRKYNIGDQTMAKVFSPNGLTNVYDLQAVFDAVEAALAPVWTVYDWEALRGAEWKYCRTPETAAKLLVDGWTIRPVYVRD